MADYTATDLHLRCDAVPFEGSTHTLSFPANNVPAGPIKCPRSECGGYLVTDPSSVPDLWRAENARRWGKPPMKPKRRRKG